MAKRKIALFGGTFDPIHLGHTIVAAEAAEQIGADEVVFVPAKCSPLKETLPRVSDEDRFKMMALATTENKKFRLSRCELKKSQPSYTLETVRQFRADYDFDASIYWLIGADSIDELPLWYGIEKLISECNLSVMYRAGFEPPDFTKFKATWGQYRVEKLQKNVIKTSLVDISSTEIRKMLANGADVSEMLHPDVAKYICEHQLYQADAD
ncbi:MAG: nicotinate (nicotinamide) nucleotide adenylyltransferase [Planctomycetes bacterium]|nr:nicotinate (nicotinamide) nucleotide adenylyltransferase [Planctomycetota bacterium]